MKFLQRFLSLLFALVLCVGMFSTTVHAENVDSLSYDFFLGSQDYGNDIVFLKITENNLNSALPEELLSEQITYYFSDQGYDISCKITVYDSGDGLVAKEDETFHLKISALSWRSLLNYNWKSLSSMPAAGFDIYYTDGSHDYIDLSHPPEIDMVSWSYSSGNESQYISLDLTAEKDIRKIIFTEWADLNVLHNTGSTGSFKHQLSVRAGLNVSLDIESKESGLLGGLLDRVNGLWETVTSGFSNILNSIIELPEKLWTLISDGLKDLFVPNEETMIEYQDKWETLLASRFGAVYQAVNIVTESWDSIMEADERDTIEFPQVSLNFSGTPFVFGGYDVKIVPDGFSVLVTAIKSIVGIVCSIAFVNGMRKRYDEIMGVEQ